MDRLPLNITCFIILLRMGKVMKGGKDSKPLYRSDVATLCLPSPRGMVFGRFIYLLFAPSYFAYA